MSILALAILTLSQPAAPAEPTVVATSPASGDFIAAGPFRLSVTFDRPMRERSYSFVQVSRESYPECPGAPVQSRDRRTFVLDCTAAAGRRYELWFNRAPFTNFRAADGTPARPHRLSFSARP